ncbi:MAG: TIGR02679 family protein [Verrucomicrobia bacterium]|nr:TIGR02679 family protein [Verrucomicrobiota bacterium]MDA1005607.1 TIGR02679 family protein [Verrucomicrobiota bacterium]
MDNLTEFFRQPALAWLLDRLVKRFKQGKPLTSGLLTLKNASPQQRSHIDDLLGRKSTGGDNLTLPLDTLATQLQLDEAGLTALLEKLHGPLTNQRALRDQESRTWLHLFATWRSSCHDQPALLQFLDRLEKSGFLKKLAKRDPATAQNLLENTTTILRQAPYPGILLANLAVQVTGDSHALDRGRPLATLCHRAISDLKGIDAAKGTQSRRAAWDALGIVIDDLSAPVLCLNLRSLSNKPWMNWHADQGEPFYLPWRQLQDFDPDPTMREAYVCENPAIVSEAANRLGTTSKPLICLNGMPAAAARALLDKLLHAGLQLHLRADFDWAGLRILDQLHQPGRTHLWRMTPADYHSCFPSQPLKGTPFSPEWASDLANAMSTAGLAAYEEDLIDQLLTDLNAT